MSSGSDFRTPLPKSTPDSNPPGPKITKTSYEVPFWSSKPTHKFELEVLKSGRIIETIPINEKEYYIFGRNPSMSDVILHHPSISRQHAVIQHRDDGRVFVYDLKSTHKTYKNKKMLLSYEYTPLRVGDMIKFGESTRMYILKGPQQLMPEEREIKRQPKKTETNKTSEQPKPKQKPKPISPSVPTNVFNTWGSRFAPSTLQEDGVMWGQSEDAVEDDEEVDYCDEKYMNDKNSHLFERLRKHREKLANLAHEMEVLRGKEASQGDLSSGQSHRMGQVRENTELVEQKIQSLEETIRDNVMNSISGTSHGGRSVMERLKQRDSDEDDEYYDRTSVNRKKKKRKRGTQSAESLQEELAELDIRKSSLMRRIKKIENPDKGNDEDIDPLDAYMSGVQSTVDADKLKKLKRNLKEIDKERESVNKLLKIARPSNYSKSYQKMMQFATIRDPITSMERKKAKPPGSKSPSSSSKPSKTEKEQATDKDSASSSSSIGTTSAASPKTKPGAIAAGSSEEPQTYSEDAAQVSNIDSTKSFMEERQTEDNRNVLSVPRQGLSGGLHIRKKKKKIIVEQPMTKVPRGPSKPDWMETEELEWKPPTNQTGDGKTKLNAKFGY